VHRPRRRAEGSRPELGFGVIIWIFPSVLGAGLCGLFAYRAGLAHRRHLEPSQPWPALELVPITDSAERPVPRRSAGSAPGEGHPCRGGESS
jgi:hypothetical protein